MVSTLRPEVTGALALVYEKLRANGSRLVADFDDLLFAGPVEGLPATTAGGLHRGAHEDDRFAAYAASLTTFDRFIVSTRALAKHLLELRPSATVFTVPNGVSERWVDQGRRLYPRYRAGDSRIIRYFAGSPTHDRDFATVVDPLSAFMRQHRDVTLEVVGPVRFDLGRFPAGRVTGVPSVAYEALPSLLASAWLSLAPLEPSVFNHCKSALKFLESASFTCPTLVSPSDDIARHAELGGPMLICRTERDWYERLDQMLDPGSRAEYAEGAYSHLIKHGFARRSLGVWAEALSQW